MASPCKRMAAITPCLRLVLIVVLVSLHNVLMRWVSSSHRENDESAWSFQYLQMVSCSFLSRYTNTRCKPSKIVSIKFWKRIGALLTLAKRYLQSANAFHRRSLFSVCEDTHQSLMQPQIDSSKQRWSRYAASEQRSPRYSDEICLKLKHGRTSLLFTS